MQVKKQQLEAYMEQLTGSKLGKEYIKVVNLHAEHLIWNAGLDESQTGIKIARRNISSLRYADNTTLMAESEEELLRKVKEESEKADLKLNIHKTKIMESGPITSWKMHEETM